MAKKFIEGTEIAPAGYANGISTHLKYIQDNPRYNPDTFEKVTALDKEDKEQIIYNAEKAFGEFLTALGCDWMNDPNSQDTPRRVAKAYVEDLWKGRYESLTEITAFPSDGYDGIVQQSNIPVRSMCSHHHQQIEGTANIAYIASAKGKVVGLSKLNRIAEHFSRRGAIQEQLTVAIHHAVDKICEGNLGVAVMINASHSCVSCRGVKHQGAAMQTAKLSGAFLNEASAKAEFYKNIELSKK